ncbi:Heat shock 70 kDa protein 17 [Raphanus sativus]|nr:Heat shock 70 kDa protein 17 [Raphanus sativus]
MMFLVSILLKTQIFGFILVIVQLETPEFEKVSTQEERKTFVEKLDEVQDCLYMDGEDANATEFPGSEELTERPVAVDNAQKHLTKMKELPRVKIDEVPKEAEKVKSWLEKNDVEQKNLLSLLGFQSQSQR